MASASLPFWPTVWSGVFKTDASTELIEKLARSERFERPTLRFVAGIIALSLGSPDASVCPPFYA
jgi:hypothetical protein